MKLSTKYFLNLIFLAFASSKAIKEKALIPKFSLASGFYDDPIELEIKTSNSKAIIYYTTDGSVPNENSTIYEKPILLKNKSDTENVYCAINTFEPTNKFVPHEKVKKANIIRAIAKLPNSNTNTNSTIVSKTYFVGLNQKELYDDVPIISLITDPYNLFDYEHGIYVLGKTHDDWLKEDPKNSRATSYKQKGNFSLKGRDNERPATIEYFPGNNKKKGFNEDVGIRIMGDVSRSYIQKSFRVFHREDYGPKELKYELISENMRSDGKGLLKTYKTFNIRNGGNDSKYLIFRDKVLQRLVRDRKLETQQTDMAILYLDGEFWGVYTITENYNDHYIATNYDIDKDNVIIIKNFEVEDGVDSDIELFDDAMNYIIENDMTILENYEKASQLLDFESFVWYIAFNSYIENGDGIFHGKNWSMWRVRDPVPGVVNADGKWRMMAFDTEYSTGIYTQVGTYNTFNNLKNAFTKGSEYNKSTHAQVLLSLLKNKEFENLFYNALCDIKNIDFDLEVVNPLINSLKEKMAPMMYEHFIRYGPDKALTKGPEEYYNKLFKKFSDFLNGRPTMFLTKVAKLFKIDPPMEVTVTSNDFSKGKFKVNHGKKIFKKEYKGDYFKETAFYLTAVPSRGEFFNYWSIENCEFANPDFTPMVNTTKILDQLTVGVLPSEGCKVTANFGQVSEITTEIPSEIPSELPSEFPMNTSIDLPTELPIDIPTELPIDDEN
ncbi:hypothetical protein BCR32DRAFT_272546 [Anaeromyces robustus]|uniref:GH29D-like beta-sandwich domain-containing protein n=1 Tax=Anaeromyces robustus TaxID=1754192 RepID=A0A1Y1W2F8_9FUNG|nr:hypothetical protein BCR32DRAFT_272546 [Anaeromyces robustus]|eukprot:ORX67731.1 hypothetical protein BCR32DRAFT_272546 [Anaeromyces robustus]